MAADRPIASRIAYRLLRPLGEGGFGSVWLASAEGGTGVPLPYAIKVLKEPYVTSPAITARLRDEARLMALIRHPSIAGVRECIEVDGRPALVMDYVPGSDLRALIDEGPAPPRAVAEIGGQIAGALAALHEATRDGRALQAVHRDVKPENLRLEPTGHAWLLDFGIARALYDEREARTHGLVGTPGYMAPERARGIDGPSGDIYSLGVVLLELLRGEPETPNPEDDAHWPVDAPGALLDVIHRMCHPAPDTRPSARELITIFEAMSPELPGERLTEWARRCVRVAEAREADAATWEPVAGGLGTSIPVTPAEVAVPPAPTGVPRADDVVRRRGHTPRLGVLALLILTGVGVGAWYAASDVSPIAASPPQPEAPPTVEAPAAATTPPAPSVDAAPIPVTTPMEAAPAETAPTEPVPPTARPPAPRAGTVSPATPEGSPPSVSTTAETVFPAPSDPSVHPLAPEEGLHGRAPLTVTLQAGCTGSYRASGGGRYPIPGTVPAPPGTIFLQCGGRQESYAVPMYVTSLTCSATPPYCLPA